MNWARSAGKTTSVIQEAMQCQDEHVRRILRMRYIQGLSWNEVAAKIGGGNTEDSVRKAAGRYLAKKGLTACVRVGIRGNEEADTQD